MSCHAGLKFCTRSTMDRLGGGPLTSLRQESAIPIPSLVPLTILCKLSLIRRLETVQDRFCA